ncbi:hypothetical protein OF83DRAFT_1066623 [Amylostereum chailletii]|nr:hypothetical protein OF83DRAFT_1066623 [Amylostereum chailletii]
MWSKFTTVLGGKRQSNDDAVEQSQISQASQASVISGVLEKHPNLSMFHSEEDHPETTDVPFPIPSPPGSPSKNGRRGMLKRLSKMPSKLEGVEPSSLRLHLPKKVKSHLNLATNESQGSDIGSIRISTDTATARPSTDSIRTPATPLDHRFGSIRSILKDKNTPATGQSVRFFSRDAYKVLTPDVSAASESEDTPFMERLQASDGDSLSELPRMRPTQVRPPLAHDLFSPVKSSSTPPISPSTNYFGSMTPLPAPEISNIFDLSQHDLPPIPQNAGETLLDNAVEIFDGDTSRDSSISNVSHGSSKRSSTSGSSRHEPTVFHSPPDKPSHDRSHSFSFGQTVFRPKPASLEDKDKLTANALADAYPGRPPSRNRAMSDTVFHSMLRSKSPEADIHDTSSAALVVYSTPAADRDKEQQRAEPDPFRANATTYYTPGTVLPPSPPQLTHGRKASREEDLIWSLRTQLALQQELCAQYEVDLGARDELVMTLNARMDVMEKESEKRKSILRSWKKKVSELERMCRYLEDEVDSSRHESMERSVMDEASSQALRQLHHQIAELEREKGDLMKQGEGFKETRKLLDSQLQDRDNEVSRLKKELAQHEDGERRLKEGIRNAQEQIEQMGTLSADDARLSIIQREQASEEERHRHRQAESEWDGERALADEREATLEAQLDEARKALSKKDGELELLRAELEAQWKNTEQAGEHMNALKAEKEAMQHELTEVEGKMETMEIEWNEQETKHAELEAELNEVYAAKEELERERQQVEEELRAEQEHAEDLTQALQEREDRVQTLEQELKFANDSATRLESIVKQRDTDLEELAHRVVAREDEVEELREQVSGLRREHEHTVNEQQRLINELTARDAESRARVEAAIKDKAEADVQSSTLQERVQTLDADIEKLRKQVHHLQQESAGKEVRISHLEKERDRLVEDAQGLNIALDSKQQELELLKRKIGVKGTAGTTPAPQKAAHNRRESTTAFTTPTVSRPDSRLSDASQNSAKSGGGKTSDSSTPMNPRVSMLGKSTRVNGLNSSTSTPTAVRPTRSIDGAMGPPPTRPRASFATPTGSHTRIPSGSFARQTVTKPDQASTPVAGTTSMRRASSANTNTPATSSRLGKPTVSPVVRKLATSPPLRERDEKENAEPADKSRTLVPA